MHKNKVQKMAFVFSVFKIAIAIQLSTQIVRQDTTTTPTQPEFSGQTFGSDLTVHSWIKFNSLTTGCPSVWKVDLDGR